MPGKIPSFETPMNIQRWLARRRPDWETLEKLLDRAEKQGTAALTAAEVRLLSGLYRSASADLARAQTGQAGALLLQDLQRLVGRAYALIYRGSRRQEWGRVLEFYRWGLPAAVRRSGLYLAVATLTGLAGGLVAWWLSWQDPAFLALATPEEIRVLVQQKRQLWMGAILGFEPVASSSIMTNNLSVAFTTVAGGLFAGVGSLYILFSNGILIGAIAALVAQNDLGPEFWAFVFPHGALEIPAIFLAGAAGLQIGKALVLPGRLRRVDAVRLAGGEAMQLLFGVVPMLVVAGVIEGFFSPNPGVPMALKYTVGMGLFGLLVLYLSRRSRVAGDVSGADTARPAAG